MNLNAMVTAFVQQWAPHDATDEFIGQLRKLLEAYGRATLAHGSFPDTEHGHGDPL